MRNGKEINSSQTFPTLHILPSYHQLSFADLRFICACAITRLFRINNQITWILKSPRQLRRTLPRINWLSKTWPDSPTKHYLLQQSVIDMKHAVLCRRLPARILEFWLTTMYRWPSLVYPCVVSYGLWRMVSLCIPNLAHTTGISFYDLITILGLLELMKGCRVFRFITESRGVF